jgi:hypothetical protein
MELSKRRKEEMKKHKTFLSMLWHDDIGLSLKILMSYVIIKRNIVGIFIKEEDDG